MSAPWLFLVLELETSPQVNMLCENTADEARLGAWLDSADAANAAHDAVSDVAAGLLEHCRALLAGDVTLRAA